MPSGNHDMPRYHAVQQIECSSWDEFKSALLDDYVEKLEGQPPLYRGQARPEWKLASPWERELNRRAFLGSRGRLGALAGMLAALLENFKDLSIGLPEIHAKELVTDDDWWTLSRHYGLTTPLLDWTKSPYVAAFFAFAEFLEHVSPGVTKAGSLDPRRILSKNIMGHVAIWSFMSERISEESELPDGLEIVQTRTDIGHRQRAQRGVFTRLTHDSYSCLEDFLEALKPDRPPLRQYLIPGREAAKAMTELRMMNITFATLFPDLSGAALQANFEMAAVALMVFSKVSPDTWQMITDLPDNPQ